LFGIVIKQKVVIIFRLASENKKISIITHVKPTFFDNWFLYIRDIIHENSAIVLPFGIGRWTPVDSVDLGRVVAKTATAMEEYGGEEI
jgi:uncharacterized protein YbjT (DUF2867 family)